MCTFESHKPLSYIKNTSTSIFPWAKKQTWWNSFKMYQPIQLNILASFLVSRLQSFEGIANFSSPKICWDKNLQMLSIFGIPGIGPTLAKAP
jgi:hypothetical protein